MKANFLRLRELLRTEFPGEWSEISGDNYPAPEWTNLAATVISILQMLVILVVLTGDAVWNYIPGFRSGPPEFYYKMKDNPALTFMIVFLVIPSYVQSFANTGAFEIFLDDKLIFSKLETGRMPNVGEIMAALEKSGLQRGSSGNFIAVNDEIAECTSHSHL
eukprot:scaffold45270_cov190-Skeletonema_marinoi.AAC.9